jgi:hypothetical protein
MIYIFSRSYEADDDEFGEDLGDEANKIADHDDDKDEKQKPKWVVCAPDISSTNPLFIVSSFQIDKAYFSDIEEEQAVEDED